MEHNSLVENRSGESDLFTIRQSNNGLEEIIDIITYQESYELDYDHKKFRQMHKVLPQLRLKKHHTEHVYDPVIVSLGPYHHGKFELRRAEEFKSLCVDWLALGNEEKEKIMYDKIMDKIDAIRSSYAETSILEQYNDEALSLMMLRDACFIISYMANRTRMSGNNIPAWNSHFGVVALPFMMRDIMRLENQVPFFVVKLLISLQQGEVWEELLHNFLRWMILRDGSEEQVRIPREHEDPPLHFLEAYWRAITQQDEDKKEELDPVKKQLSQSIQFGVGLWKKLPRFSIKRKKRNEDALHHSQPMFQSVMDLKAKGIFFSPSSYSLKAVRFKSFSCYGKLHLPIRYASDQHQVMLSNLIAYELSPGTNTDYTALSYTILMKSLIESPEDVKELQKMGILYNKYSNHEQVVKAFQNIDTFGLVHLDIFSDVKEKIGWHCRNSAKTWMADLIYTRFRSPWRIVAFLAATMLLCFALLQTIFTILYPK